MSVEGARVRAGRPGGGRELKGIQVATHLGGVLGVPVFLVLEERMAGDTNYGRGCSSSRSCSP